MKGKIKVSKQYTKETQGFIIKTVMEFCDQISQENCCKAYKLGLGEKVTLDLWNNIFNTIGCGDDIPSLREQDVIVAVCTSDGKEGMVFSLTGIYYRKNSISSYTKYHKCHSIYSIVGLNSDQKFLKEKIKEMFRIFCKIFELSELKIGKLCENLCEKMRGNPEFFRMDNTVIDEISNCILSVNDFELETRERRRELKRKKFNFLNSELKKINEEDHYLSEKKKSMIKQRNVKGSIDVEKEAIMKEIILYSLEIGYFLDQSFDKNCIYSISDDKNRFYSISGNLGMELKNKALGILLNAGCDFDNILYNKISNCDSDEFIAVVDLSEGKCSQGMLFQNDKMYILDHRDRFIYNENKAVCYGGDVFYDYEDCYFSFDRDDLNQKFNPYRLNHVLDKLHRITEVKHE